MKRDVRGVVQQGDGRELIKQLKDESVHLILSDIPYGIGFADWDVLHDNANAAYMGQSPAQQRAGEVFGKRGKPLNGWSGADRQIPMQYYDWCKAWAPEWLRVLKPGASAFVFAGRRMAHRCICAMEDSGFLYKDSIAWVQPKAARRAQRLAEVYRRRGDTVVSSTRSGWRLGNLGPIYEPILWFVKPHAIGTSLADNMAKYGVGAFNEKAFLKYAPNPDNILCIGYSKGENRLHPAQKPLKLMGALIELVTRRGQVVLDPFAGSGTTVLAAQLLGRKGIGFEIEAKYVKIAKERLVDTGA